MKREESDSIKIPFRFTFITSKQREVFDFAISGYIWVLEYIERDINLFTVWIQMLGLSKFFSPFTIYNNIITLSQQWYTCSLGIQTFQYKHTITDGKHSNLAWTLQQPFTTGWIRISYFSFWVRFLCQKNIKVSNKSKLYNESLYPHYHIHWETFVLSANNKRGNHKKAIRGVNVFSRSTL